MGFFTNYQNLCELRGQTPTGVALKLGISRAAVNRWRNGTTPSGDSLAKIAEYFNVSINYLVGESDNRKSGVINGDDIAKVALFGGDSDVTDEMWAEVKNYAAFVKERERKK